MENTKDKLLKKLNTNIQCNNMCISQCRYEIENASDATQKEVFRRELKIYLAVSDDLDEIIGIAKELN